ncbi:MAG TPA: hypothetical protein VK970_26505, partial [Candidatus Methylacidiphilales bacterium]|nr:hypothetical protein [Candidatus Methylacidiphilales bacterium]
MRGCTSRPLHCPVPLLALLLILTFLAVPVRSQDTNPIIPPAPILPPIDSEPTSTLRAADLVPATSLAFFHVPDGAAAMVAYGSSNLKKLIDSPELRIIVGDVIRAWAGPGTDSDALLETIGEEFQEVRQAFAGEGFVVLRSLQTDTKGIAVFDNCIAAGLRPPKGGARALELLMQHVQSRVASAGHAVATGTGSAGGVPYHFITLPAFAESAGDLAPARRFCVAQHKGWLLFSWGEGALTELVDRLEERAPADAIALSQSPTWRQTLARVSKDSQAIYFAQLDPLLRASLALDPRQDATWLFRHMPMPVVTAGVGFHGPLIVDNIDYTFPPAVPFPMGKASEPCAFDLLKYTSPQTIYYTGGSVDIKAMLEAAEALKLPNPMGGTGSFREWLRAFLGGMELDADKIIDSLGFEYALIVNWNAQTGNPNLPVPEAAMFLKIKTPADIQPALIKLRELAEAALPAPDPATSTRKTEQNTAAEPSADATATNAPVTTGESHAPKAAGPLADDMVGGVSVASAPVPSLPYTPTITTRADAGFIAVFSSKALATAMLAPQQTGTPPGTILDQPAFIEVQSQAITGANSLQYFNTPFILENAWPLLHRNYKPIHDSIQGGTSSRQLPDKLNFLDAMTAWVTVGHPTEQGFQYRSASSLGHQFMPMHLEELLTSFVKEIHTAIS